MMTTQTRGRPLALSLAVLLSLTACEIGEKSVGTDGVGDDETAETETSSDTADSESSTTNDGETAETETSSDTTGEASGTGTTTADPDPSDWVALCDPFCDVVTSCFNEPDPACLGDCVDSFVSMVELFPACVDVNVDFYACLGALSCEEALGDMPCEEEYAALGECEDPGCETSFGGPLGQNECVFSTQCTLGPLYEVSCADGGECVCSVDGEVVETCANRGQVCGAESENLLSAINSCCDWDLEPI